MCHEHAPYTASEPKVGQEPESGIESMSVEQMAGRPIAQASGHGIVLGSDPDDIGDWQPGGWPK